MGHRGWASDSLPVTTKWGDIPACSHIEIDCAGDGEPFPVSVASEKSRVEVRAGIEPTYADLQSAASPFCHRTRHGALAISTL